MKLRAALLFAASLAVIMLSSCDVTPENYRAEPNIYAILSSDSSSARIMVGLTASLRDTIKVDTVIDTIRWDDEYFVDTIYILPWNGVSDAEVVLNNGLQNFTLKEDPDSAGYYYLNDPGFAAGQTWQLEVTYPTKEQISAQTTLPGEFEITSPLTDSIIPEIVDSFFIAINDTLSWTAASNAAGYLLQFLTWRSRQDEEADSVIVDSSLSYPMLMESDMNSMPLKGYTYMLLGDSAVVFLSALDSNAYDYYYYHRNYYYFSFDDEDTLNIDDYMHIEGAWGVFGSQTVVRSRTYVLNAPF